MLKLTGFIITAILLLAFLSPNIFQNLKQKTIEFINPAAKEKRLLNDLNSQINELALLTNNGLLSENEKTKRINSLVQNSQSIISEIESLNNKGDITSTISSFLQKILPGDKQKLSPQPTWFPPGLTEAECKRLINK